MNRSAISFVNRFSAISSLHSSRSPHPSPGVQPARSEILIRTRSAIAAKHYLQVTDDHFTKALQQPAVLPRTGSQAGLAADEKTHLLSHTLGEMGNELAQFRTEGSI